MANQRTQRQRGIELRQASTLQFAPHAVTRYRAGRYSAMIAQHRQRHAFGALQRGSGVRRPRFVAC